jgi:fatty-acyl-CoA synthase
MKISFSTLACPNWSWQEIYGAAKDLGFNGIEVRGLGNEIFSVKAQPFTDGQLPKTVEKLNSLGLEIACLSSGACLKFKDKYDEAEAEIKAYAQLASKLGTSYIRILADLEPAPVDEVDDDYIVDCLKKLIPIAEEYNVTLLVETNGVYADSARLAAVLDKVASRKIAALWDMHHPYRYFSESPETTVANLGQYIKYTHIKDSVMKADGTVEYRLMGSGDMPVREMMAALASINYDGYVSLEWVKRWASYLSDGGIVIPSMLSIWSHTRKSTSTLYRQV